MKYLAGPEIGGGNFLSDTAPEEKAARRLVRDIRRVDDADDVHNLLGENVKSKDAVGISTPSKALGSTTNVKLRFDPTYMKMAADGKL